MAAENMPRPSTSVPPFECRLPQEFLKGLDERGRFLYETADKTDQRFEWLIDHSIAQAARLEEVRLQTTKTNGGLTQAKADIQALKERTEAQAHATAPVVHAYGIANRLARSRIFWGCAALFVLFGLPWLIVNAPAPAVLLKWALGIGTLGL